MALAHFSTLINDFLNKNPDIVLEEVPLIILDSKCAVCMANNTKDTKQTMHIARRVHFVTSSGKCKMHKIDFFEGGLK